MLSAKPEWAIASLQQNSPTGSSYWMRKIRKNRNKKQKNYQGFTMHRTYLDIDSNKLVNIYETI